VTPLAAESTVPSPSAPSLTLPCSGAVHRVAAQGGAN
jgi:hypothetical protein